MRYHSNQTLKKADTKKIKLLIEKIKEKESKATSYYFCLYECIIKHLDEKVIDEFNIITEISFFSDCTKTNKKYEVELGNPIYEGKEYCLVFENKQYSLKYDDYIIINYEKISITYAMHCLLDHSELELSDILKINDIWIEIKVDYQFSTLK